MISSKSSAIDWFGDIDNDNASWGQYDPLFNFSEEFERNKLKSWVQIKHATLTATQQKNILSSIHYFRDAADEFMMDVGNGNFYCVFDDELRNETIRTLKKYWRRAKESYWGKDNTMKWSNNGIDYEEDIPFGPWLFWSKSQWNHIDETFDRWKAREIRNKIINKNNNSSRNQITQSVLIPNSDPINQQQSQLSSQNSQINQQPQSQNF